VLTWLFRSRTTNNITVAQFPNLALSIFLVTVALRLIVTRPGAAHTAISWTGVGALTWWACDEVVRGVNPWRRLLGLGGCAVVTVDVARLLR
jgi:hypothetical protein